MNISISNSQISISIWALGYTHKECPRKILSVSDWLASFKISASGNLNSPGQLFHRHRKSEHMRKCFSNLVSNVVSSLSCLHLLLRLPFLNALCVCVCVNVWNSHVAESVLYVSNTGNTIQKVCVSLPVCSSVFCTTLLTCSRMSALCTITHAIESINNY